MRHKIGTVFLVFTLLAAFMMTSCSSSGERHRRTRRYDTWSSAYSSRDTGGSSDKLRGSTLIVMIFASDADYSWDFDDPDDMEKINNIQEYLNIACDYLTEQASSYGVKTWFTSDFMDHSDLMYKLQSDEVLTDEQGLYYGDADEAAWDFIDENIDEDHLRDKYRADNVIYFMAMNTDASCDTLTCTRVWYPDTDNDAEIVYLLNVDLGTVNPPAVYAHEILHTFGAPDLYDTNPEFGISRNFLDYVNSDMPNDIMLTCSDPVTYSYVYDRVPNDLGEVTAYYVGLTDHSDIVDEWDLDDPEG